MKRAGARVLAVAGVVAALGSWAWLPAAGPPAPGRGAIAAADTRPRLVRTDPRLDELLAPGTPVERVAAGFTWVEGPLWHPVERYLLVSDIPRNAVFRWSEAAGLAEFLKPSGYTGARPFTGREPGSNGLAWDPAGRLVLCQHGDRRIVRLEADGRLTVLADRYGGRRLNSPNDLVFSSSGELYFTDPPFGLPGAFGDPEKELAYSGVYRLSPAGDLTLLTPDVRAPNGIALSSDERLLYVSNADREDPVVLVFPIRADGSLGEGSTLFDASEWVARYAGGPDGLVVDERGNLWAAGPGGVHIVSPDGRHLGAVITGGPTSNVAWGERGELFITAGDTVWRVRTGATRSG